MASAYGREQCRRQVTTRRLKCARAHTPGPPQHGARHTVRRPVLYRVFSFLFSVFPLHPRRVSLFFFYSSHQTNAVRFLDLSPPPPPPGSYNNITIDTYRTHNIIPKRIYIYKPVYYIRNLYTYTLYTYERLYIALELGNVCTNTRRSTRVIFMVYT